MTVIKNPSQRWPITFAHFKRFSGRHIQHFRDNRFKSLWNDLSNSLNGRVRYRTYDFHRNTAFDYYTRYWPKIALWHSRHRQRQKCRHFLSSHMSSTSPRVKQALSPYEIRLRFFFLKLETALLKLDLRKFRLLLGILPIQKRFCFGRSFLTVSSTVPQTWWRYLHGFTFGELSCHYSFSAICRRPSHPAYILVRPI